MWPKSFDDTLGIDGVILTKLDGDTRGGAALSVRAVTGKPIKFVGIGRKTGGSGAVLSRTGWLRVFWAWAMC